MSRERMPVEIRGKLYAHAGTAAKALKIAESTVYCGIMRGNIDRIGLGPDYKARKTRGGRPKTVTVAGKKFSSVADLARFINRSPKAVRASLTAGEDARQNVITAVIHKIAAQEKPIVKAYMLASDRYEEDLYDTGT